MADHPSSSTHPNIPFDFSAAMAENQPHNHTLPNNLGENLPNPFLNPFVNTCPIDPSSPLFLHSDDNPRILLVSQPLTGENYSTWSRAMLVL
jgi:hypothetical protein